MDPAIQQLHHHKIRKTLKVKLRNLQKELKLGVKIDRTLIRLPEELGFDPIKGEDHKKGHKLHKDHLQSIVQQPSNLYRRNQRGTLTCRPVDATLLIDLAKYAQDDEPLNKSQASCLLPSSTPSALLVSPVAKSLSQDWSEEEKSVENHFGTSLLEANRDIEKQAIISKHCPRSSPHYLSNMENKNLDPKSRQDNLVSGDILNLTSEGKMILASNITNNNQSNTKEDDNQCKSKTESTMQAELLNLSKSNECIKEENSNRKIQVLSSDRRSEEGSTQSKSQRENDSDQMVPQVPLKELNVMNGSSVGKTESVNSIHEDSYHQQAKKHEIELHSSHGISVHNGCNKEEKERDFADGSSLVIQSEHKSDVSFSPSRGSQELPPEKVDIEQSEIATSIGQKVDEEIKALLDGSDLRNGSFKEEHNPTYESKENMKDYNDDANMKDEHTKEDDGEGMETNNGSSNTDVESRDCVQSEQSLNENATARGDEPRKEITPEEDWKKVKLEQGKDRDSLWTRESQPIAMKTSVGTEEDTISKDVSGGTSVEIDQHGDSIRFKTAKIIEKVTVSENGPDESAGDSHDSNHTSNIMQLSSQTDPGERSFSNEIQHSEISTMSPPKKTELGDGACEVADQVSSASSDECKVGRKGLKQQQSQSLLEAEVTAEQTAVTSTGREKFTISIESAKVSASETRSQSVIVTNPRSASDTEGRQIGESSQLISQSHVSVSREEDGHSAREEKDLSADSEPLAIHHTKSGSTEHPELFQALTPPPQSVSLQIPSSQSVVRFKMAEMPTEENVQALGQHPAIQITSIRTLAPLTNASLVQSVPTTKNIQQPNIIPPGHLVMTRQPLPDSLLNHKEIMKHNVILQGPPVSRLQAPDGLARVSKVPNKENDPNHLKLLNLSVRGSISGGPPVPEEHLAFQHGNPRTPSSVGQYIPVMQDGKIVHTQGMVIEEEKKTSSIPYNPEEQQQHFLEIKRHLLTSKANVTGKKLGPIPRIVPVSVNGFNNRPVISVAPVTKQETITTGGSEKPCEDSKTPSPIGKFSGAMMEHVRHWKEQNELNHQPQNLSSMTKVGPNLVPVDTGGHPMVYPSMVPSHPVAPLVAVEHPAGLEKREKGIENPNDINHGLLENLQALHKMYFKTMQGTDKVIFPKMSPKKPGMSVPGAIPEMVQVVKPFMTPPIQPQMIPRLPPESQIPPELLNYHMNVVARNIPAPGPMSPSVRKAFQPRMIPPNLIPNRHHLSLTDMSGRFPRPLPISDIDQIPKSRDGMTEIFMVPPKPSSQFLLSPHLQLPGKSHDLPRELPNPDLVAAAGTQGLPMMLLPPGAKFIAEKNLAVSEAVRISNTDSISPGVKRKAEDGAPLDLSTSASKVRRVSSSEGVTSGDQPIDLSVKSKALTDAASESNCSSLPPSTKDGKPIPVSKMVTYPGLSLEQHASLVGSNQSQPNCHQRFLVPPQFLGVHGPQGVQSIQTLIPQRIPQPRMSGAQPQLVSSAGSTPLPPRVPLIESQRHLPSGVNRFQIPDQVEMMKLVSGNTSQLISHNLISTGKHAAVIPNSFSSQLLAHAPNNSPSAGEVVQSVSDVKLDQGSLVKRKRGRPKGSTNKRRFPAVIPPPLQVIEPATNTVSTPVSIPSETAECQFCDFKAASRGDVRQHVKVVHFAKFRRNSSKSTSSCDALTPTSEYSSIEQQLPVSSPGDKVGEWTTVSESSDQSQMVTVGQVSPHNAGTKVSFDSERSNLVIDVSSANQNGIGDEGFTTQGGEDSRPSSSSDIAQDNNSSSTEHESDREVNRESTGKPPLKITLRRISAPYTAGGTFSPLPQEKSPPDKKPKFICQTCGASYNYVNGLREHESRHRVDLPFECGVCHLKYKTQGMLSRHQAQKNHQVSPE